MCRKAETCPRCVRQVNHTAQQRKQQPGLVQTCCVQAFGSQLANCATWELGGSRTSAVLLLMQGEKRGGEARSLKKEGPVWEMMLGKIEGRRRRG